MLNYSLTVYVYLCHYSALLCSCCALAAYTYCFSIYTATCSENINTGYVDSTAEAFNVETAASVLNITNDKVNTLPVLHSMIRGMSGGWLPVSRGHQLQ